MATTLGHELTGEAAATLARPESSSSDAYDFYLQGAEYLQDEDRKSVGISFDFFSRAVQIDPNVAEAHVGPGAVYLERYWSGRGGGAENLALASKRFEAAFQLNPKDMRARRGMMLIEFYRGRGEAALRLAEDAARIGSGDIETLLARAEVYSINGPSELAEPLLRQVLSLDPGNQTAAWLQPIMLQRTDRFKETIAVVWRGRLRDQLRPRRAAGGGGDAPAGGTRGAGAGILAARAPTDTRVALGRQ